MSKNFLKIVKRIFYFFVTKKMLLSIIIALIIFILLKTNAFGFSSEGIVFDEIPDYIVSYVETEFAQQFPSETYDFVIIDFSGYQVHFFPKTSRIWALQLGKYRVSTNQQYCAIYVDEINQTVTGHGRLYTSNDKTVNYSSYLENNIRHIKLYSTTIIYEAETGDAIFYNPNKNILPFIDNTLNELFTLNNVSEITINPGNMDISNFQLSIANFPQGTENQTVVYQTNLTPDSDFYDSTTNTYNIPTNVFLNFLTNNYKIIYLLTFDLNNTTPSTPYDVDYSGIFNHTADEIQDDTDILNNSINTGFSNLNNFLNNKLSKMSEEERQRFIQQYELQQQQLSQQQEANETAKDTNNFLKNQNFDNNNLNLPTSPGNDITQDGINNIFNMIYNAFTSGQAQNVVMPIPFTGKNIEIPANYVSDVLSNSQFSWVKTFIELFWWYIISTFIIKDIANKMNKAKSGDFENLENSNIKEDML